jgi:hypothetical protein
VDVVERDIEVVGVGLGDVGGGAVVESTDVCDVGEAAPATGLEPLPGRSTQIVNTMSTTRDASSAIRRLQ